MQENVKFTLSLAGRTKSPVLPNVACRIGGFGGASGLANYLKEHNINALICATHPFARKMPFNALEAGKIAGVHVLFILRPQWQPQAGDKWIEVENHGQATSLLGVGQKRVFLTVGRLELAEYATAPQHFYVVRSIDEVAEKTLPNAEYITSRPPFSIENERELMQKYKVDYLITKNSGGADTENKLIAARELKIPVILIKRPVRPDALHVETANEAIIWLQSL